MKIQKKHGFKKACMAVGRKLAVIMHRMWVNKADFVYGEHKGEKAKNMETVLSTVEKVVTDASSEVKKNHTYIEADLAVVI